MSKPPIVSVVSISYNQEKYIRQTLESFIAQKTDFDFEVVIADDCSTDKTQEIIKEFSKGYPKIFRPILRKKNVGVQPNLIDALQTANGKYIALCEGDDFWTDSSKLQKQADFLNSNSTYSLCFHPVKLFFENGLQEGSMFPEGRDTAKFTIDELLRKNFVQTNSVMYRKQKYDSLPDNILPMDWYLHLYHAQFGKIGFIDRPMAAYRRHSEGLWWIAYENENEFWKKYGLSHTAMYIEVLNLFKDDPKRRTIIYNNISSMLTAFMEVDKKYPTKLLKSALLKLPEDKEDLTTSLINQIQGLKADIEKLKAGHRAEIEHYKRVVADREHHLKNKTTEAGEYLDQLNDILNSKSWHYVRKVANLKATIKKPKK